METGLVGFRLVPWIPWAHAALDLAARRVAGARERLPHPPVAVGVRSWPRAAHGCDRADARARSPGSSARRWCAGKGGRRYGPGSGRSARPETLAVRVDERARFGRSGSSSLAKTPTPT